MCGRTQARFSISSSLVPLKRFHILLSPSLNSLAVLFLESLFGVSTFILLNFLFVQHYYICSPRVPQVYAFIFDLGISLFIHLFVFTFVESRMSLFFIATCDTFSLGKEQKPHLSLGNSNNTGETGKNNSRAGNGGGRSSWLRVGYHLTHPH